MRSAYLTRTLVCKGPVLCYVLALSKMTFRPAISLLAALLLFSPGCRKPSETSAQPAVSLATTNVSSSFTNLVESEVEIDIDKSSEHLARGGFGVEDCGCDECTGAET